MNCSRISKWLYFFKFINLLAVTSAFAAGWVTYYNNVITWSYQYKGNLAVCFLFLVVYFLFIKIYDAYAVHIQRKMELIISHFLAIAFADGIMYIVICLLYEWLAPVWPLAIVFMIQGTFVFFWVIFVKNWYLAKSPKVHAAIIHDNNSSADYLRAEMPYHKDTSLDVYMDILDCLDADWRPLKDIDTVYICVSPGSERNALIEYCTVKRLHYFLIPSIDDMLLNSARRLHMYYMPMLQLHMGDQSIGYLFLKRTMDIVLSSLALLVLWPVMLIIALVIKLYDGGPAFYKQVRLTKGGKEFKVIKFRSMRVDAEADGVARLSTGDNDSRITPVGKWLRRFRLDELPQLLNILSGSMSIVGPRPERPEISAKYEKTLPEFRLRLQVKAGLTGYAQIYGKYNSSPREKLHMDMIYISRPSIIEDIRLIFATLRVLFMKESTQGVEEGQITANK